MAQVEQRQDPSVYVIVARPLHAKPDWSELQDWRPVGYTGSLEEAWAGLDLIKERERDSLHGPEHPHEREYDVWTVDAVTF